MTQPTAILFLFTAFAVGALMRQLFKNTPIPYTVSLMVVGLVFGALSANLPGIQVYTRVTRMDPHLILYIFMPTLIFESAFAMDVHTFKKMTSQIVVLAFPGMLLGSFLTAIMARFTFSYGWSWAEACMFGSIMAATDPVAVVALLKDIGASRQLGTLMEGESLLNDGTAIVMFTIFLEIVKGGTFQWWEVLVFFIRVAIGGPIFVWTQSNQ